MGATPYMNTETMRLFFERWQPKPTYDAQNAHEKAKKYNTWLIPDNARCMKTPLTVPDPCGSLMFSHVVHPENET
jgi:hypothetical protein